MKKDIYRVNEEVDKFTYVIEQKTDYEIKFKNLIENMKSKKYTVLINITDLNNVNTYENQNANIIYYTNNIALKSKSLPYIDDNNYSQLEKYVVDDICFIFNSEFLTNTIITDIDNIYNYFTLYNYDIGISINTRTTTINEYFIDEYKYNDKSVKILHDDYKKLVALKYDFNLKGIYDISNFRIINMKTTKPFFMSQQKYKFHDNNLLYTYLLNVKHKNLKIFPFNYTIHYINKNNKKIQHMLFDIRYDHSFCRNELIPLYAGDKYAK